MSQRVKAEASAQSLKSDFIKFLISADQQKMPMADFMETVSSVLKGNWISKGNELLAGEPKYLEIFERYTSQISVLIEPDIDEEIEQMHLNNQIEQMKTTNPGLHQVMLKYKNYHTSEPGQLSEVQRMLIDQLKATGLDLSWEATSESHGVSENRRNIVPVRLTDKEIETLDAINASVHERTGLKINRSRIVRELIMAFGSQLVKKYEE